MGEVPLAPPTAPLAPPRVQLDRVSCTLGGATRPCELHLRDSMTPRDYLGPPFLYSNNYPLVQSFALATLVLIWAQSDAALAPCCAATQSRRAKATSHCH